MAVSQPSTVPKPSESTTPKAPSPDTTIEKREEVDQKTANKNRAAFFKKS